MVGIPKVSVVMPVWNAAKTVERAVGSVLSQTFKDFELIVVDDGSKDESLEMLRGIDDQRVCRVVLEQHGGVVAAANAAVARSCGEFVARMDADDWCHPERLERQVALLDSDPGLAVAGCGVRIVSGGDGFERYAAWLNALTTPESVAAQRFIESPVANPSAMFRRSAFEDVGGWCDTEWAEDYDLFLRMLDVGMRIAKVPEVLLEWTDGPSRLTRTDDRYSQKNFLRAKAHYLAKLPLAKGGGVRICGAGPIGKRIAKFLRAEQLAVHAFYEVHPRRIGERIGGVPVLDQSDLHPASGDFVLLGAVGLPGVREDVRKIASGLGYREGVDYFSVA